MRLKRSGKLVLLLFACLLLTTIPFLFGVLHQPDEESAPAVEESIPVTPNDSYTPPDPIIIEVGTVEATWTRQAMLSATQTMQATLTAHD